MTIRISALLSCTLTLAYLSVNADAAQAIERNNFLVDERPAFVMDAGLTTADKPWVWYAPTLDKLPARRQNWYFERLLAEGVSVAGINLGEVRGAPSSSAQFTLFYEEMVRLGYSPHPVLLGQSRGGLMLLAWTMRNPEKPVAFAGIYPVCNLGDWPFKSGSDELANDYGMTKSELRKQITTFNPIDNLAPLAEHKLPIFIIHGDNDTVVPYEKNGQLFKERYQALGGEVEIKIVPGGGHASTPDFFEDADLLDFILQHAASVKDD